MSAAPSDGAAGRASPLAAVCVFCGASRGASDAYVDAARAMGHALAESGRTLVYGGASVGCMGALADAALEAGGRVVGVIPRAMVDREIAHRGLTELHIVRTMHERKALMAERADAFVALPGGLGTLEELFEVWTWGMLGLHDKPLGALDVGGYFDALVAFLDHAEREGFVRPAHRAALVVAERPAELLRSLERWMSATGAG